MPLLVFETKKDNKLKQYLDEVMCKIIELPAYKVPLTGDLAINSLPGDEQMVVGLNINIRIPKEFPMIGLVGLVLAAVLTGSLLSWYSLIGFAFLFTKYFWSVTFWRAMFVKGLKRFHPAHHELLWLRCDDTLLRLLKRWDK